MATPSAVRTGPMRGATKRGGDVGLLDGCLALEKQGSLRVVIGELLGLGAHLALLLLAGDAGGHRNETLRRAGLEGATPGERVRLVGHAAAGDGLAMHAI